MDTEASPFESSEMVASFLASTPLLNEAWKLCSVANTAAAAPYGGFVTHQIGDVGYFAFSSNVTMTSSLSSPSSSSSSSSEEEYSRRSRNLVALGSAGHGFFSPLTNNNGEEEAVMVHAGLLNLFLGCFQSVQNQMVEVTKNSKSIVITGHSIGGTTASLCALWLLSYLQSVSPSRSVLCITFGSPLLGNESLSRAILRERWGGNFCHVVSKHDIMPRLLFAPLASYTTQLHLLMQHWTAPQFGNLGVQLGDEAKAELFLFVAAHLQVASEAGEERATSSYCPFGNYLFCSQEGAICVDNAASVIKMMYLTFTAGNPSSCIEDHLKYGEYVGKFCSQFLNKRSFMQGELPQSSWDAGVALALQSLGISGQESASEPAKECLKIARRLGRTPNLKCADLAVRLSRITPYRAEIEWYKGSCDKSDEKLGYYDAFRQRGFSKMGHRVNMNRHKLAAFWNGVIEMLDKNELPHNFHRRAKWVNASQFYMLLVEPLEIAEYYRSNMHLVKGHYLKHGRERRFEIFDRWWREKRVNEEENRKRIKFAGLTQDSCFWAKVEEARECVANVRSESDARKQALLWDSINNFDMYAARLVERKEVSEDVVAKNSSYKKLLEELTELRSAVHSFWTVTQFPSLRGATQFPSLRGGEVVP
ncbi:PREDICTED: lipase-like PAD4 isoform X1 [Prunus mume]|uniref:Lipase-like PAD4 isoform X1 n=1 Tax=Prunus mume TaxID=102107 RepID=A0ABM0NNR6_PRUMU|nr:PREDICTED: lipase-like PAD4 isoform X1 [Prunus mume]